MTSIWGADGEGWRLLPPAGFPSEAGLHTLIERAPQLLPLAGSPQLAVVGREVHLGSGNADLLAVEASGRLCVIEVKLARNGEARRAVVAQVISYASHLHGLEREHLETVILGKYLRDHCLADLYSAAAGVVAEAPTEERRSVFEQGVDESLSSGRFRLVIVLDEAPDDLVRLVGYLEQTTDRLIIDLVTVSLYSLGTEQVAVPIRVEPERWRADHAIRADSAHAEGSEETGITVFRTSLADVPQPRRAFLEALSAWAVDLEDRQLARLVTYSGVNGVILRVYVPGDMSLATVNSGPSSASVQLFRSVFERRAPVSLRRVEELVDKPIAQGTAIYDLPDGLLGALNAAYEEAHGGKLSGLTEA